jgi:hypothetical protein
MLTQTTNIKEPINASQQVIAWHVVIKVERIKEPIL